MSHPFDLSGRVAVVTGGNGGLGLGMARTLAALGAGVSIWGRNEEKNAAAVQDLSATGATAHALAVDITDAHAVEVAFAQTLERFERVDAMFANAGVSPGRKPSHERTAEEWRDVFAANVDGVVNAFKPAARHMMERAAAGDSFGRLVATSSVASVEGAAQNEPYAASKGALNAYVRALAVELARHGITVNAILPGFCVSDMTKPLMDNDVFVSRVKPRIPMRRFGEADDFGGLAAYLASPLSSYHTGQMFVIDGGYTIF